MNRDTKRFLELLNKQNERVAAITAKESITEDPIRIQRETDRRAKFGKQTAKQIPNNRRIVEKARWTD